MNFCDRNETEQENSRAELPSKLVAYLPCMLENAGV